MADANLLGFELPFPDELYAPAADDSIWPYLPMRRPEKVPNQPEPFPDLLPDLPPHPVAMRFDEGLISVDEFLMYVQLRDKGERHWTRRERVFRDKLMASTITTVGKRLAL